MTSGYTAGPRLSGWANETLLCNTLRPIEPSVGTVCFSIGYEELLEIQEFLKI